CARQGWSGFSYTQEAYLFDYW
nr:immunoglobulin heavy chain junction region [Macaca mulatta]